MLFLDNKKLKSLTDNAFTKLSKKLVLFKVLFAISNSKFLAGLKIKTEISITSVATREVKIKYFNIFKMVLEKYFLFFMILVEIVKKTSGTII
jgi:hypothetical protein